METKPENAPIGNGMAKKSVDTVSAMMRYKEAALEAAVAGRPMPDFEEWKRTQG